MPDRSLLEVLIDINYINKTDLTRHGSLVLLVAHYDHFPNVSFQVLRAHQFSKELAGSTQSKVTTRARRVSVSTLFRVLPNIHEYLYNVHL